jgi:diacylglycerol kinase
LQYPEWLIILSLIVLGLVVEMINTAIETTTDAITKEWRNDIKIAKDVAAASMLVFATGAGLIACTIYIPKLLNLLNK